ncbi:sugar transferase [Butyrivibrio sp. VCD2006]|uniref:sugar transferase n=1 Tax=Butyrivibrio sp. VCD2006 TaxID=1280664 RepID=UPI00040410A7|nr:sugar transferase [Butyrivibrio sp. VCD2006]
MTSRAEKSVLQNTLIRAVKLWNILLVTYCFAIAWMFYYSSRIALPFYRKGNYVVIILFMVVYYYLTHLYGGFLLHIYRVSQLVYAQGLSIVITNGLTVVIITLLNRRIPNLIPLLMCMVIEVLVTTTWSLLAHKWYLNKYQKRDSVVIWDELEGLDALIEQNGLDARYRILRTVNAKNIDKQNMDKYLGDAEVVFLCSIHSHDRNQIIKYCVRHDISAYVIPRIGDVIMSGAERVSLMNLPMLLLGRYNPTPEYLLVKRIIDIVVSGLALIVLSPLMVVVGLIIRSDGGTAFYRQKRLTKDGQEFYVLKFRSMRMDAEKDGVARLSTGDKDDRITPIGRFIRSCRIDELPQLINILKGEMTIVGPRPERPEIAEKYMEELPEFVLRLQAKAGLTGYAQVYGKYNTTPYDKLLMDLMYIARPSLIEDLKIMFATVKILFMAESTEGIAAGQTTAMGVGTDKKIV